MSEQNTPAIEVTTHPDGSVTFPADDVEIIKSALLWARLGAERLAQDSAEVAGMQSLEDFMRDIQRRNADYHTTRAAQWDELADRTGMAIVRAQHPRI